MLWIEDKYISTSARSKSNPTSNNLQTKQPSSLLLQSNPPLFDTKRRHQPDFQIPASAKAKMKSVVLLALLASNAYAAAVSKLTSASASIVPAPLPPKSASDRSHTTTAQPTSSGLTSGPVQPGQPFLITPIMDGSPHAKRQTQNYLGFSGRFVISTTNSALAVPLAITSTGSLIRYTDGYPIGTNQLVNLEALKYYGTADGSPARLTGWSFVNNNLAFSGATLCFLTSNNTLALSFSGTLPAGCQALSLAGGSSSTSTSSAAALATSTTRAVTTTTTTTRAATTTTTTRAVTTTSSTRAVTTTMTTTTTTTTRSSTTVAAAGATRTFDVTGLTYVNAMLTVHNFHRANHSEQALVWDTGLANTAQQIASSCVYAHNTTANGGGYGQNIGAGSAGNAAAGLITNLMYNGEINNYPLPYGQDDVDISNFSKWGHYSQLVWADTTNVGCATVYCPNGLANTDPRIQPYFTVCNYSPPGNFLGEFSSVLPPQGGASYVVVGS